MSVNPDNSNGYNQYRSRCNKWKVTGKLLTYEQWQRCQNGERLTDEERRIIRS